MAECNRVKVRYMVRDSAGVWRYNRRVPEDVRTALGGLRLWNLSVGRDAANAVRRVAMHAAEHDELITRLRDENTSEATRADLRDARAAKAHPRVLERIAKLEREGAPTGDVGNMFTELWKRTPLILAGAEGTPDTAELARLGIDAADWEPFTPAQARLQLEGFLTFAFSGTPPAGRAEAMQYQAYESMLRATLKELTPPPPVVDRTPPEMRLTALLPVYIKAQALRPKTATSYISKVARLVRFAGDAALPAYDADTLRNYRDRLIEGVPAADGKPKVEPVKPSTVHQYFAPLKALWKWAADEYPDLSSLSFPRVRLPKEGTTIEETRWQAFDDEQIKAVWRLLKNAWGPESKSRLSPARRRAFLMAVRVLLHTGMRPVEVFHLTSANVEGDVLHIRYTKTKTVRKIPLAMHLSDLPDFLAEGGFAAELEAGRTAMRRGEVYGKPTSPGSLAGTLSDAFREVVKPVTGGNNRLVLYSLKDTLIDRLQRQEATDDLMRGIIGHTSGQGKLRHYKTSLGNSPHGMAQMRRALDAIVYW